jgi:hypothetical protein
MTPVIKIEDFTTAAILYEVDLYNPNTQTFHLTYVFADDPQQAIGQCACQFKCSCYGDEDAKDQMHTRSKVRRLMFGVQGWGGRTW